jgi:hypothetical protein
MFVNIEAALFEYLDDLGYCVTSTPSDLQAQLPVLRIARAGGGSTKTQDSPRVSIQGYTAADYLFPQSSLVLLEEVRERVLKLPAVTSVGRIDSGDVESGPVAIPWPDAAVDAAQIIVRFSTRRR